jgi:hypothetical protein
MAKNAVLQVRGPMAAGSEACTSTSPPQVPWHLLFWSTRRKMEAASDHLCWKKFAECWTHLKSTTSDTERVSCWYEVFRMAVLSPGDSLAV